MHQLSAIYSFFFCSFHALANQKEHNARCCQYVWAMLPKVRRRRCGARASRLSKIQIPGFSTQASPLLELYKGYLHRWMGWWSKRGATWTKQVRREPWKGPTHVFCKAKLSWRVNETRSQEETIIIEINAINGKIIEINEINEINAIFFSAPYAVQRAVCYLADFVQHID